MDSYAKSFPQRDITVITSMDICMKIDIIILNKRRRNLSNCSRHSVSEYF